MIPVNQNICQMSASNDTNAETVTDQQVESAQQMLNWLIQMKMLQIMMKLKIWHIA